MFLLIMNLWMQEGQRDKQDKRQPATVLTRPSHKFTKLDLSYRLRDTIYRHSKMLLSKVNRMQSFSVNPAMLCTYETIWTVLEMTQL